MDPVTVPTRRKPLKSDRIETSQAAAQVNEAMAKVTLRVAYPFSAALMMLFACAAVAHGLNLMGLPDTAIAPLLVLDAVVILAMALLWLSFRLRWLDHRHADPMGFGICTACALVPLASLYLAADPFYSLFVMLILLGNGSMALSLLWFGLVLAALVGGWLGVAAFALDGTELVRYGFAVAAAAVLSGLIYGVRRRQHTRLVVLRDLDEQHAGELAAALKRVGRELEERQRVEAALRESEERYRTLIESQGEGIGIVDPDENFVFANPAAEHIFGLDPEGLVGRNLRDFVPEEEWARITSESEMRRAGQRSTYSTYEMEFERSDGERRSLLVTVTPSYDGAGVYAGAFDVFRDITDRKRAEEEAARLEARLHQARKMESLGLLAGGIAHDFNNLLMGMMGHAELAAAGLAEGSRVREDIDEVLKGATRAAGLCQQMLAYSGKGRFVSRRIDLRSMVGETIELVRGSLSAQAEIKVELWDDLPTVEGDPSQIGQVAMNLITNASEALGDEPGVITISADAVTFDEGFKPRTYLDENLAPGTYARLIVSDTGCGMDEETLHRVFDPFFTTKFTGRGLGLAAVLGIVRGHRGGLEVDSRPGEGTVFRVLLPAAEALPEPADEPAATEDWRGGGTVLLADDEAPVRRVAGRLLEQLGFEVQAAADGQEAVELFRASPDRFDFVVLDATMPRMSGEEAFRAIRTIRSDARVLLTSGYAEEEAAQHLRDDGLAGFLQKPFRMKTLQQTLREVLG